MARTPNKLTTAMLLTTNESQYIRFALAAFPNSQNSPKWWDCLRVAWLYTNWTNPYRPELKEVFGTHRGEMMLPHERRALRGLPETLTVYRGDDANGFAGKKPPNFTKAISWTLDKSIAARFARVNAARRFNPNPVIATATVRKADACALLLERGEREVITFAPRDIKVERFTKDEITKLAKPIKDDEE